MEPGSYIVTDPNNYDEATRTYIINSNDASSRAFTVPSYEVQNAIKHIINTVTEDHLRTFLDKLVGFGSRYYCAPGMYSASDWLYNVLDGNGRLEMEYHNFSLSTSEGDFLISNVILTLPGWDKDLNRTYYLFAHTDSMQDDKPGELYDNAPGANDDGSGCAAVLEAARVLSYYDFQDTIKFAFFNAEELGSIGSDRYAQNMTARNEVVRASINYDMIGFSKNPAQHRLTFYYHPGYTELEKYLEGVNSRYQIGLTIIPYETTGAIPSDIQSFYNYGYPGVLANDADNYPHYHTTEDTVDKLDFSLMGKSTRLAVASLAEWARLMYIDVSIPPGNLIASNTKPNEDDLVNITVNVTNSGNLNAADLKVAFYQDGKEFASNRITVPASGSNSTSILWQAADGSHDISVILDPSNEIIESDETNNNASITVSVNDRPRAVLNAYPTTAYTNEIITFDGSLSWDDIGGVSEFNFDFGDGKTTGWTVDPTITHAYTKAGTYTSSLLVKDPDGAVSKPYDLELHIKNRAPTATPSSNLTHTLTFVPIQFYSNAVDYDGEFVVLWTFGDGSESTELNPIHFYSKSGRYDVNLELEDDDGATTSYEMGIVIDNRPPAVSIDVDPNFGNITTNFIFSANATDPEGSVTAYLWDFGDGYRSSTKVTNHYYKKPGKYVILLSVRDDEDYETRAYVDVTITDMPPEAKGKAFPTDPFTNEQVTFKGEDSYDPEGPVSFSWEFGDGNRSSDASPTHTYMKPGIYSVNLTVFDLAGQTDKVNIAMINVRNRPPEADFKVFGELIENRNVYFDGTRSSDPEGDLSYSWDFGDGTTGYGPLVEHVYAMGGEYYVNLTVTDESGESKKTQQIVTIYKGQPDDTQQKEKADETVDKSLFIFSIIAMNVCWIILLAALFLWVKKHKKNVSAESPISENEMPPSDLYPSYRFGEDQSPPARSIMGDPVVYPGMPQVTPQVLPTETTGSAQTEYFTPSQESSMPYSQVQEPQLQNKTGEDSWNEDAPKQI